MIGTILLSLIGYGLALILGVSGFYGLLMPTLPGRTPTAQMASSLALAVIAFAIAATTHIATGF